tara:strand:- start:15263 stop:16735 length:1473 start_codon:yes stop_codon:yes gene_type:complete
MAQQKTVRFLSKNTVSIRKIGQSLSNVSKSLSSAFKSSNFVSQQTNKNIRGKRKLIRQDSSFFSKRLQNIRRKDREDMIEASSSVGPTNFLQKNIFRSTKGFLGRILDFFGILLIGWAVTTLPSILKRIGQLIGFIKRVVSMFTGFLSDVFGIFSQIGGAVTATLDQIKNLLFFDEQAKIQETFNDINLGFNKLSRDLEQEAFNMTKTDEMGLDKAEEMLGKFEDDMGMEEEKEEEEPPKEEPPKEDDKKDEKPKEDDKKKNEVEGTKTTPKEEDLTKKDTNEEFKLDPGEDSGFEMYKDGTSKVKKDGLAYLHKDEAVIPADSVKTYGVEFIEKIIANTEQSNLTKKKAANQLYRTLVRQVQEEKGFVTEDEAEELFEETVTKLKESLKRELPKIEKKVTEVFNVLQQAEKTIIPELKNIAKESKQIIDQKIKTNRLPQTIFIPSMSGGSGSKPAPKPTPKRSNMTQSSSSREANKYMLAVEAISTAYL